MPKIAKTLAKGSKNGVLKWHGGVKNGTRLCQKCQGGAKNGTLVPKMV